MHYPFVKPEDENTSGSRKRRAVRMVNGINCTPYDIAHARGYLSWLVTAANHDEIQTCLGQGINFLSSGQWGQGYNKFSIYLNKIFYLISVHPTINFLR